MLMASDDAVTYQPCVRCGIETKNDFCGIFICDECYSVFDSCCNEIERVEQPVQAHIQRDDS